MLNRHQYVRKSDLTHRLDAMLDVKINVHRPTVTSRHVVAASLEELNRCTASTMRYIVVKMIVGND